ncbi:MAG TPA: class I SAM-dependent methyltransferase, partial [Pyrinomonadaceae bacterium]
MTDARFEAGAPAYAAYLQTVEGRLRLDIAWENFLSTLNDTGAAQTTSAATPPTRDGATEAARDRATEATGDGAPRAKRALDLGGGTGALALRFAAHGWHVSLVDPSATMLALAADDFRAATLDARATFHHSTAERARELFAPHTFDAAVCHNVLEYVSDPEAAVRALAALVKTGALVSLVARNRAGESMRAALKAHDLEAAAHALAAAQVNESLYGGPARLYDASSLAALAEGAGLRV